MCQLFACSRDGDDNDRLIKIANRTATSFVFVLLTHIQSVELSGGINSIKNIPDKILFCFCQLVRFISI